MLFMLGACSAICTLVFFLYELPLEPVLYSSTLCLVLLLLVLVIRFLSYRRKLEQLETAISITDVTLGSLPRSASLVEAHYQTLCERLHAGCEQLRRQMREEQEDMLDYYTLWVHQIKTPIMAMRLLLGKDMSDEGEELKLELFHIEQYVEMVLSYLRLSSDTTDYVIAHHDVDAIVRSALHKYSSAFLQKHLQLDYTPCHLEILTDDKWLQLVIEQVLSNAIKYTNEKSIHIYVEDEALYIRDEGIGIDAADLPRVFEKGYTGFNGRRDKQASGLGLYLCKRIMHNLNHTISITSALGKGTCVRLDFSREDRWI